MAGGGVVPILLAALWYYRRQRAARLNKPSESVSLQDGHSTDSQGGSEGAPRAALPTVEAFGGGAEAARRARTRMLDLQAEADNLIDQIAAARKASSRDETAISALEMELRETQV